jgi:VanZ family protein
MKTIRRWAEKRLPEGRKRRRFYLFCALALLVAMMAWLMSALPPDASQAQSGWLRGFLQRLFGAEVNELLLRKLAHFSEYLLLGLFLGLSICQLGWQARYAFLALSLALLAAVADETIQVFSSRGPSLIDVWIDLAGAATGLFVTWLISRKFPIT